MDNAKWFKAGTLDVGIFPDRATMGAAAARHVLDYLDVQLLRQERVRVLFACAPSQDSFMAALVRFGELRRFPWARVEAMHMDEYVGLPADDRRSFRHYLKRHLLDHVDIGRFYPIAAEDPDSAAVAGAYAAILEVAPIDLICLGIGENGHVAFNDPPVADFADPRLVKVVELDPDCRRQQVNDGCFARLDAVPRHALTVTVPVFLGARALSCVVPGARKAEAVRRTLNEPVGPACPATLLRAHPQARLFVDVEAGGGVGCRL
jgi:glucosamine-6-phosphate deaminase